VSEKGEMATKSVKLNRKQGTILVVERADIGLRRFQSTLCLRQNCGRTYVSPII